MTISDGDPWPEQPVTLHGFLMGGVSQRCLHEGAVVLRAPMARSMATTQTIGEFAAEVAAQDPVYAQLRAGTAYGGDLFEASKAAYYSRARE